MVVLADEGERADGAIERIIEEYQAKTGKKALALRGSSPGASHTGSELV